MRGFNWLRRFATKAATPLRGRLMVFEGQWLQWPSWNMTAQIQEGLERNTVVYSCIDLIVTTAGGIPWCLYRKKGTASVEIEDPASPLLKLLRRPNPMAGQSGFIQETLRFWLATGNAFVHGLRVGPSSPPRELWSLRPDRVAIQPVKRGEKSAESLGLIDHYEYRVNAETTSLPAGDILHLKLFQSSTSEWYGLSPIQVASLIVDTDNKSVNWNRSLIGNRGRPDSIWNFRQTLTDEQHAAFKRRLDESYSGDSNSGRPVVIDGTDFVYTKLSATPEELDFLGTTAMSSRRICQVFGVAPELVGDPANKTYANAAEARLQLVENNVFPKMDYLRDALNNWLVPQFGDDLYLDYNRDAVDVIAAKRKVIYETLTLADFLSVNEKREAAGYDKVDDPDADVPERLLGVRALDSMADDVGTEIEDPVSDESDESDDDQEGSPSSDSPKRDDEEKALKFWNLETNEQRARYWKSFDTTRRAFEGSASKLVAKRFAQERASVVVVVRKNLESGAAERAAANVIRAKSKAMQATLATVYRSTAAKFFRDTRDALPKKRKSAVDLAFESKDLRSALSGLSAYLGGQAKEKSEKIADATTSAVGDLLKRMILEGKSTDEVVTAVEELYAGFERERALKIAETEVGMAANAGVVHAGKSLDRPLKKAWISMGDERVRDPSNGSEFSHRDESVKAVGLDDLFDVSGEKLEFPGDSSHGASPGNVINCRCAASLVEVEE